MKWALVACAVLAIPGSLEAQYKTGERVRGNVKDCFYSYLGQTYVHTVASYGICPLSVNVNPEPTLPPPSGGTAFKTGENLRGNVKDCYYSHMGQGYLLTIGAYELCPLSVPVK
jgi:hypothetical protein